MVNKDEIKKILYRKKTMAKLSHYVSGNLYYTIELDDGVYQFSIPTIEKEIDRQFGFDIGIKLSDDLGTTKFSSEMRGSELIRWILKSIDSEDFVKIDSFDLVV